jgi:hypothetical protein
MDKPICRAPYGCALPFEQCCGNPNNIQNRMVYNPKTGRYESEKTFEEMRAWKQEMSKLTHIVD